MKKKQLPRMPDEVFVKIENEAGDADEQYLAAYRTADEVAEKDKVIRLGRYQRVEVLRVRMQVETTPVKTPE